MNCDYPPISLMLRSAFGVCAMSITATILLFIDLLASDRTAAGAHAVTRQLVILHRQSAHSTIICQTTVPGRRTAGARP